MSYSYNSSAANDTYISKLKKKAAASLPTMGTTNAATNPLATTGVFAALGTNPATGISNNIPGQEGARPTINGAPVQGPMMYDADTKFTSFTQPKQTVAPQSVTPATPIADKYKELALSAAEQEVIRRKTAAQNLYNQTIANLDTEQNTINPNYQNTIKEIQQGSFNNTEAQKELMNQFGWGLGNSGLAVGEVNKIANNEQKAEVDAKTKRDQLLADIARRKTLANSLLNSTNDDTAAWKAAQTQGIDAEAFLKAADEAKQNAKTEWDKYVQGAQLDLQRAGVTGSLNDGTKTLAQKTYDDNKQILSDQTFTNNTGMARINDSMIAQDDPLRNVSDYAALINNLKSNPELANNSNEQYTLAAATYLRNQKINAMKDSNPELYNKYKNTIDYKGTLIPTSATTQWDKTYNSNEKQKDFTNDLALKTYNSNEEQRDFTNDLALKTFDRQGEQWNRQFDETIQQNDVENGLKSRQIGVSEAGLGLDREKLELQKSAQRLSESSSNTVSAAYSDFVSSGKTFDDWLKTAGKNGVTYGQVLSDKELNALIDMAKSTGKFNKTSDKSLEDILGIGGN